MRYRFPDGKRFAFTVIDDTDVATVDNVEPVYRLLERLGMRTTKTVWPFSCPEGSPDFDTSQTLEDPEYLAFVVDLQRRGFEIASHGATMESSERGRTIRGLDRMRDVFGAYPAVHANHANNRENLYWGAARIDDAIVRTVYRLAARHLRIHDGEVPSSPFWWGDVARERIQYVRNLTFDSLNVAAVNPTMPYHDPRRPSVKWWFSAADAENCAAFNELISSRAQDRLEREGGIAIVATHFGKHFVRDGRVHDGTAQLLEQMSRRPGWFIPVGELLDWLRANGHAGELRAAEWRRMQWRWLRDLVFRTAGERLRGASRARS